MMEGIFCSRDRYTVGWNATGTCKIKQITSTIASIDINFFKLAGSCNKSGISI